MHMSDFQVSLSLSAFPMFTGVACEPVFNSLTALCTAGSTPTSEGGVCSLYAPAITILFLSDVGIFIVHVWCATQTRPRFYVPSERRGVTSFSNTQIHSCTMPGPGIEPGPLPWEAVILTTRPLRLSLNVSLVC